MIDHIPQKLASARYDDLYDAMCVSVNIQVFGRPDESKRRAFCGIKVKVEKNLEKEISRDAIATRLIRRTVPIAAKASNWDLI